MQRLHSSRKGKNVGTTRNGDYVSYLATPPSFVVLVSFVVNRFPSSLWILWTMWQNPLFEFLASFVVHHCAERLLQSYRPYQTAAPPRAIVWTEPEKSDPNSPAGIPVRGMTPGTINPNGNYPND
ncbi:MAG: hypothetical protein BWY82_01483 [Verrucomicrobia bacterium ADurb.Bin474]|nr:MAG: hypothetical protein BWY82_01483 [Verrucomicrobia bacterium ADurb.Bin474]